MMKHILILSFIILLHINSLAGDKSKKFEEALKVCKHAEWLITEGVELE